MTRLTGDIDMIRHTIAWIIKTIVESFSVFIVTIIYFYNRCKLRFGLFAISDSIHSAYFHQKKLDQNMLHFVKDFLS